MKSWEFDCDNSCFKEWEFFVDCVNKGNSSYVTSEGLKTMLLAEAAKISAQKGEQIEVTREFYEENMNHELL